MAPGGEIDDMIRNIAVENDAELVTSDKVQASVARAKGIRIVYLQPDIEEFGHFDLMDYFTDDTMSVHLKADVVPMGQAGAASGT